MISWRKMLSIVQRSVDQRLLYVPHIHKLPKRCSKSWWKKDPEHIKQMPVFQFAGEKKRRNALVYAWGGSSTGALGHRKFVRPAFGKSIPSKRSPFRVPFAENHQVLDIACGNGFTMFSAIPEFDCDYKVFGTGLNVDSQIGYHCVRKDHPLVILSEPVPISIPFKKKSTKVLRLACGRAHSVILTDEEGVFSLGNNAYGQCGRTVVPNEIYGGSSRIYKIQGIDENTIDVVCGQDHTLFLTKDGKVYTVGSAAGHPLDDMKCPNAHVPQLVKGDIEGQKIVQLSSTLNFVLALSDKGELFGWGDSEYGQLLSADCRQTSISRHMDTRNIGKIVSSAAAGSMCGVINEHGDVYVWGLGILGKGPNVMHLKTPTLLPRTLFGANEFSPHVEAVKIYCGLNYFAVITNKHDLYTWGKNENACLGLGHEQTQYFPFRVCLPAEVVKVSCGYDHMIALCKANC